MRKLRVVLVDDEIMIREGFKKLFDWGAHDCEVVGEAADGVEALGVIDSSKRYNGLLAPQQIVRPAKIVPSSIPTVQSSDNGYNIYLDLEHERQGIPCVSRACSTFRMKNSMCGFETLESSVETLICSSEIVLASGGVVSGTDTRRFRHIATSSLSIMTSEIWNMVER